MDTLHYLGGVERLGDEVVGAEALRPGAVGGAGIGGEHQHGQSRGGRSLPDATQGLEAVQLRHGHVEQDEVGGGSGEVLEGGPAAVDRGDLEAGAAEDDGQDAPDLGFVVDDEDPGWQGVRRIVPA